MSILREIAQSLEQGDEEGVGVLVRKALDERHAPLAILHDGLMAGMDVVGLRFRDRDIFLPDVLMAARAMQVGVDLLEPLLSRDGMPVAGRVVIGTVHGDMHDIGKNLVGIMLRCAGFDVIDLGTDVRPERFVDAAQEQEASVIGLSALLTTTMPVMKEVVALVRARGLDARVKVIVGGAPVSEAWAREIGADGYGYDAANAVERVRALMVPRA